METGNSQTWVGAEGLLGIQNRESVLCLSVERTSLCKEEEGDSAEQGDQQEYRVGGREELC